MRDRFPVVVVAGLVVLVVLGGYLLRGAARGQFADVLSTWRSEPDGARALYLLTEESGIPVGRKQTDLEVIPDGASLVLLGVFHPDTEASETDLYRVEPTDGGTGDGDHGKDARSRELEKRGRNAFLAPFLGEDEREKLLEHIAQGNTLVYVAAGSPSDPLLGAIGVSTVPVTGSPGLRSLVPPQPSIWTRGVEHAEAEVRTHLTLPDGGVPLLTDAYLGGVVAAWVPWGSGQVVVISAPDLAMNRRLAQADNAQLWLSLLGAASGSGSVLFDEFHHGFSDDRSMAAFAARYGLHFAILQLLVGVSLWAFALRRFGRPRLPPEAERVGSTDALFAASRIYREGRHHGHAAGLLARGVAQDLAPHAGLPLRAQPEEISRALRARGETQLADLFETTQARAGHADSERDVEQVARHAAEIRRHLHQRRRQRTAARPGETT